MVAVEQYKSSIGIFKLISYNYNLWIKLIVIPRDNIEHFQDPNISFQEIEKGKFLVPLHHFKDNDGGCQAYGMNLSHIIFFIRKFYSMHFKIMKYILKSIAEETGNPKSLKNFINCIDKNKKPPFFRSTVPNEPVEK